MCHVVRITARPDGLVEITPDECSARQPHCREHSAPFVEAMACMTLSDVDALGGLSHTATIKTSLTDEAAIQAACRRLGLEQPTHGVHKLYGENTAEGLGVMLKGWRYPVVINTKTGAVQYDDFGSGYSRETFAKLDAKDMTTLGQFQQAYAVERAKAAARSQGHNNIRETVKADGSIVLNINVGA